MRQSIKTIKIILDKYRSVTKFVRISEDMH